MLRLQRERERIGLSRAAVARRAQLQATLYGWIENGRYTPYERELARIADGLNWSGEARSLLEEVGDDA